MRCACRRAEWRCQRRLYNQGLVLPFPESNFSRFRSCFPFRTGGPSLSVRDGLPETEMPAHCLMLLGLTLGFLRDRLYMPQIPTIGRFLRFLHFRLDFAFSRSGMTCCPFRTAGVSRSGKSVPPERTPPGPELLTQHFRVGWEVKNREEVEPNEELTP